MTERALAPIAETTMKRRAPATRAARAKATTRPKSTRRNAARLPAALMVVPSAEKASSTVSPRPAMAAAIASKLVIRGRSFGCSMPSSLRLTAMICLYLGSARSRRSRCPPTSPVAPARRAVRCDDASVMIEPLKSAGHVEGGSHRKGRPGRGEPIGPLDWLRLLPHAAAASSDRLGWVGLEAARRATLAFELNVPVLTHQPPQSGVKEGGRLPPVTSHPRGAGDLSCGARKWRPLSEI